MEVEHVDASSNTPILKEEEQQQHEGEDNYEDIYC